MILRCKDASEGPMLLVGNKSDLQGKNYCLNINKSLLLGERVVTKEEGQEFANSLHIPFIETSAKNRENVDEMFMDIVREIRRYR
jgi:GTPase SAR1 family protein